MCVNYGSAGKGHHVPRVRIVSPNRHHLDEESHLVGDSYRASGPTTIRPDPKLGLFDLEYRARADGVGADVDVDRDADLTRLPPDGQRDHQRQVRGGALDALRYHPYFREARDV